MERAARQKEPVAETETNCRGVPVKILEIIIIRAGVFYALAWAFFFFLCFLFQRDFFSKRFLDDYSYTVEWKILSVRARNDQSNFILGRKRLLNAG